MEACDANQDFFLVMNMAERSPALNEQKNNNKQIAMEIYTMPLDYSRKRYGPRMGYTTDHTTRQNKWISLVNPASFYGNYQTGAWTAKTVLQSTNHPDINEPTEAENFADCGKKEIFASRSSCRLQGLPTTLLCCFPTFQNVLALFFLQI